MSKLPKIECIINGLTLFKGRNELNVATENDIIYAGKEVSEAETETLREMGWSWDDEFDCWSIFT